MDLGFFILLAFFFILGVISIVILRLTRSAESGKSLPAKRRYIQGEFSGQKELDLRLPYRRFRQLYPETRLTYTEYKNLQMKTAFRRSMSSQENKRMVR